MIRMAYVRSRGIGLALALGLGAIGSGALGRPHLAAAHASSIRIVTFYPATKAAFDIWNNSTSTADPPRTDTFPVGTTTVAFYFHYRGAQPNVTHFTVSVRTEAG